MRQAEARRPGVSVPGSTPGHPRPPLLTVLGAAFTAAPLACHAHLKARPRISHCGRGDGKGRLMLQGNLICQTLEAECLAGSEGRRGARGALPTRSCCSRAPTTSCRFVLSSGPTSCLYCHFSGTKGHFISFASWTRVLSSLGMRAEKVRVQVRKLQTKKRLSSCQRHDEAPWWQKKLSRATGRSAWGAGPALAPGRNPEAARAALASSALSRAGQSGRKVWHPRAGGPDGWSPPLHPRSPPASASAWERKETHRPPCDTAGLRTFYLERGTNDSL